MPTTPHRSRIVELATPKHVRGRTPDRARPAGDVCGRCYTQSPTARRRAAAAAASPRTPSRHDTSGPGGVMRGYPSGGQRPSWVNLNPPNTNMAAAVDHQARGYVGRNRTMDPAWAIDEHSVLGGKGYPNWTLGDDGKAKAKARPAAAAAAAGPSQGGSDARDRAKIPPRGLHRPGFRDNEHAMGTYPNWTLAGAQQPRTASPGGSRRQCTQNLSTDDIEGARPALTKFNRKAARRIVADPYPDRATCPVKGGHNKETTHTITPDAPKVATVRAEVDAQGRPLPVGQPLYNPGDGTLRTKEVEVFKNGAYHTTEVVTQRGAALPRSSSRPPAAAPVPHRSHSANLRTSDIAGARPKCYGFDTPPRLRGSTAGSPSPAPRRPASPAQRAAASPRAASMAAYQQAMQSQISFF